MLEDKWSSPKYRRLYWKMYKRFRSGKLGDNVKLVKLVDKLYRELHPEPDKPTHPDLTPLKYDGDRPYANPDRPIALYLKQLARDEPDDFIEVNFNPKSPSNPYEQHPIVRIKRPRKKVTELPSSDDW